MEKYEYTEMTINRIRDYVAKYYRYTFNLEIIDLATETVANALFEDKFWEAIDRSFTYTKNEWLILQWYCSPRGADWDEAEKKWVEDITDIYEHFKDTAPWED